MDIIYFFNRTIFYFYGKSVNMSINMSQIDNKKYTYIIVLSFKTFDRSCLSMYQLYFSIYILAHPSGL